MYSFAIVLVAYNRLGGLKRLLGSLEKVNFDGRKDIHLIFSVDNSGKNDVIDFANNYQWVFGEKHVRTFPERQGLKKHILSCGDFTEQYDIVVILEDDLYVSDSMYHYASQAARYYADEDKVAGISLYNFQKNWLNWTLRFEPQFTKYDTYFLKVAQSWGQVWTKDKWRKFKSWYKQNEVFTKSDSLPQVLFSWPESSWLKYHDRFCMETDRYFVYPYVSVSTNFSDAGEHSNRTSTDHQVELMYGKEQFTFTAFSESAVIYDEYMDRMGLSSYLGIDESCLTVDFWGTKPVSSHKKYLLSTQHYDYKIIKRFALSLRPIELAVINNISGFGITLYDTEEIEKNKKWNGNFLRHLYSLRSRESKKILRFAVRLRLVDLYNRVQGKIKKCIRKLKN